MTLYKITISDNPEPYFVEATTSDEAVNEVKTMLSLDELSGDVEEVVQ